MGRHRSASGNRRVSRGLILAAAAIVVVIAVIIGWLVLRDHAGGEGDRAAAACVNGPITVPVTASPAIAPALTGLARTYTEDGHVVRDRCVTVDVESADGSAALAAITGGTGPAVWVPQSTAAVGRLRAQAPDRIDGNPVSLAASPVVLGASDAVAATLQGIAWKDLPGRQSGGGLGLAMPAGADAAPTELTLAASIADAGPDPAGTALSGEAVTGPDGKAAAAGLVGAAPGERSAASGDVLAALAEGSAPDGVKAVPTTAQQLYRLNTDSGAAPLSAVRPAGPTPVVDYPAVLLQAPAPADGGAQGGGADDPAVNARDLSAAASDFLNYLAGPDQRAQFTAQGFLVADGGPEQVAQDSHGVLTGTPPEQVLPGPTAEAATALASAVGAGDTGRSPPPPAPAPSSGGATTILLDVSGSMGAADAGTNRLDNVTRALDDRIGALADSDHVGLWTYSADLGGSNPYRVVVPTGALSEDLGGGTTRRQALIVGLDSAEPHTATHTYRSLQAAYASAVDGYVDGGDNSVLLITDGPNDDRSFRSTRSLLDAIAQAGDPATPVRVDVLVIGPNDDIDSLRAVADATGGTVTEVTSSADPALGDAADRMLH